MRGAGLTSTGPADLTDEGFVKAGEQGLLMLVIEVDDTDLRRAAIVYLSTLSGEAQKVTTRHGRRRICEHIASGAYWTNRTGKTGRSFTVDTDPEALGATLSSGVRSRSFSLEAGAKPHLIRPRPPPGSLDQRSRDRAGRARAQRPALRACWWWRRVRLRRQAPGHQAPVLHRRGGCPYRASVAHRRQRAADTAAATRSGLD